GLVGQLAGRGRSDQPLDLRFTFDEQDQGTSGWSRRLWPGDWLHLDVNAMRCAVEFHRKRRGQGDLIALEGSVKRAAQLELDLLADEFGYVGTQCSARRLEVSAGIFRKVKHAVRFVDENARWCQRLQRLAMRGASASNGRVRLVLASGLIADACQAQQPRQNRQSLGQPSGRLVNPCLPVNGPE